MRPRIDLRQVKTGRPLALPLLPDVADALSAYLLDGRPASTNRTIFLRHCAPFEPFAAENNLATIMREPFGAPASPTEQGVAASTYFAIRWQHGCWLPGSPLKAIADVLGHASTQTTTAIPGSTWRLARGGHLRGGGEPMNTPPSRLPTSRFVSPLASQLCGSSP